MLTELKGNNPDSTVKQSLVRMDYYNLQDDTRQTSLYSGNTSLISETDHPYLNETGLYSNEMHDININRPMRGQGNTVYEAIPRRDNHIYTYIKPEY